MPVVLFVLLILLVVTPATKAGQLSFIVEELNLNALKATFDDSKISTLLGESAMGLKESERRAAAVLVAAGILNVDDLASSTQIAIKFELFKASPAGKSDHLIGPFGAAVTQSRLDRIGDHSELLDETKFIDSLNQLLNRGVITGYDLRKVHINAGFDPELTLTYSHSSVLHLKQLSALLSSENIEGFLYAAPKVSAFLFRDDWGEPPANVATLKDGTRVVNGREWVVFFEFKDVKAKHQFHQVITRYAKKDEEDEQGLIAESWWQPFYYSETMIDDFEHINLILLRSDKTEATLTVLPEKVASVRSALISGEWDISLEDVWVNKPFYRFLHGDYK